MPCILSESIVFTRVKERKLGALVTEIAENDTHLTNVKKENIFHLEGVIHHEIKSIRILSGRYGSQRDLRLCGQSLC